MPDYTKLHLYSSDLTATNTQTSISISFKCPNCGKLWTPKNTFSASITKTTDYNQKVAFLCTNCGSTVTLFVAMHRDPTLGAIFCLQKSSEEGVEGISTDWWSHD